ncbi:transglutaminase domain-containing protein [Glycomyces buryatensis]|uniref:Transglutaminase domain-containing protein n=1 Tax=Glycomyces buryatensis TaxID=2570927 RepID=A0A4S8Q8E5_9ACTN|nr:transglutaminase domain-containing protein [Glycomyces buryatensis]THV37149.1 transglutaminase domain-containing protein [Glycomyces buryatensis]
MSANDSLAYYTRPGPLTAAGGHQASLETLPGDVPALFEAVPGLLIHEFLPGLYGLDREPGYTETGHLRSTEHILGRLLADGRPLAERREPADRLGGSCRHFTLITVAALRAHGIPARARCGFGTYFQPGWHVDHWVAEYWNAAEGRWILGDAQMDPILVESLNLDFDPVDIPRDKFVVAGQAWESFRAGELDPDRCGLADTDDEFGWWWIAGNLIRDTAALANMELLPWDVWGAMPEPSPIDGAPLDLFDRLASLTADPDTAADVRELYEAEDGIRVPDQVFNFIRKSAEPVLAT